MVEATEAAIEELIASPPALHSHDGEPQDWGLDATALSWLADHVHPDWRTLETGCGLSSVVFALKSADHTIVAPVEREHELVREWCAERGHSTDHVRSLVDISRVALPKLENESLDLALIDGSHSFPVPFVDWYFMAVRLRVGGYVVIDDMHIRTCRTLRDFLATEKGRWQLEAEVGRAVVFEKLTEVVIPDTDWAGQPWCMAWTLGRLRFALRLRSRLHLG